jgi:ribosomal-protein-alanine N-acetyltransferase
MLLESLQDAYRQNPYPIGGTWNERLLSEALSEGEAIGLFSDSPIQQLLAFVIYRRLDDLLDITVLATNSAHQRKGLMKRLFCHVLEHVRPRRVWLEVHEANTAAVLFYEKMGFQLQGRRLAYYRDGGTALLYSLDNILL